MLKHNSKISRLCWTKQLVFTNTLSRTVIIEGSSSMKGRREKDGRALVWVTRCYGCRGIGKYTSGPTDIPLVGGLVGAGWIEVKRNINPVLEK